MKKIGDDKTLAKNKIIILEIIDKAGSPISEKHLLMLIINNKLMNFFVLMQLIFELKENSYIAETRSENKKMYSITDKGKQTLDYFIQNIPPSMIKTIYSIIEESKKDIKLEKSIIVDYEPNGLRDYLVNFKIMEGNSILMEVKAAVGTKNDARQLCRNFKENSEQIYIDIINTISKRE